MPVFLCLFFFFSSASANQNLQLNIAPSLLFFNYAEYNDSNFLLDKETGTLPGISSKLMKPIGNHQLVLIADYHAGLVDYDGHTQSYQPITTDTYEQLARLGIQLELAMALTDTHFIMGLHKLYWDRDIYSRGGVQGLHEIYQWYEIHAGFNHRFFKTEQGYGWAQLTAFNTSSAKMEIRLPNETPKFNLGEKPGVKISLGWQQSLDQSWHWGVSAFVEYREFGKSPSVFVNDFYGTSDYYLEPRSESKFSGVNLHFTYSY